MKYYHTQKETITDMMQDINQQYKLFYSNGFEKAKAGGQKFLKHLHELNTKLHGKHWLYTVLANRFNVC